MRKTKAAPKPKAETAQRAVIVVLKVGKHLRFRLTAESVPRRRGQRVRVEIDPNLSPRDAATALERIAEDLRGADQEATRRLKPETDSIRRRREMWPE